MPCRKSEREAQVRLDARHPGPGPSASSPTDHCPECRDVASRFDVLERALALPGEIWDVPTGFTRQGDGRHRRDAPARADVAAPPGDQRDPTVCGGRPWC